MHDHDDQFTAIVRASLGGRVRRPGRFLRGPWTGVEVAIVGVTAWVLLAVLSVPFVAVFALGLTVAVTALGWRVSGSRIDVHRPPGNP